MLTGLNIGHFGLQLASDILLCFVGSSAGVAVGGPWQSYKEQCTFSVFVFSGPWDTDWVFLINFPTKPLLVNAKVCNFQRCTDLGCRISQSAAVSEARF